MKKIALLCFRQYSRTKIIPGSLEITVSREKRKKPRKYSFEKTVDVTVVYWVDTKYKLLHVFLKAKPKEIRNQAHIVF